METILEALTHLTSGPMGYLTCLEFLISHIKNVPGSFSYEQ